MEIIKCDRCGAMPKKSSCAGITFWRWSLLRPKIRHLDLCEVCEGAFRVWLDMLGGPDAAKGER